MSRGRGVSGPWAARSVRSVHLVLIGVLAAEAAWFVAHQGRPDLGGALVLTVMFAGYVAGALVATGDRSTVTPRALTTGAVAGTAVAAVWVGVVVLRPPVPPGPAVAVVLACLGAIAVGAALGHRHGPAVGRGAAAVTGTTAVLLILNAVTLLSAAGPARLVPHLAPPALPVADQVAASRIELTDRYLWLLLVGWLISLALCAVSRFGFRGFRPRLRYDS